LDWIKVNSVIKKLGPLQGLRFNSKHDLRVEVRFASDDLSLVIFGQPTPRLREYYLFSMQLHFAPLFLDFLGVLHFFVPFLYPTMLGYNFYL